jgi:hypothetical protein
MNRVFCLIDYVSVALPMSHVFYFFHHTEFLLPLFYKVVWNVLMADFFEPSSKFALLIQFCIYFNT